MKKTLKYVLLTLLFVGVFVLATWAYNNLDKFYTPENPGEVTDDAPVGGDTVDVSGSSADSGTNDTETESEKAPVKLAPDFEVLDADGNTVKLSDFFGRPIVINFWATWCGPCKNEMPAFNRLYKTYGDDVTFLMVNLTDGMRDTVKKASEFVRDNGYSFPVYFDTEYSAAMAYGVSSIPMSMFIYSSGEVADYHIGMMDDVMLKNYIIDILEN